MSKKKATRRPRPAETVKTTGQNGSAESTRSADPPAAPRLSRKEMRRQQQEREKRMRALRIGVPVAIVVLGLIALLVYRALEPEVEGAVFVTAAIGNQHDDTTPSLYPIGDFPLPPTGGVHRSSWQNCGIYTEPLEAEYVVHSMEHGAIWVTYHPDLPAEQIAVLQDTVRGESYTVLSPYPDQSAPIVLTAWDIQLQVESADDARIAQFINKYQRTRGPEAGASCQGSVGNPIS